MSDRRFVILARPDDAYEGFERPGLGAVAHELEAAQDIPGLRRLLTDRARAGDNGYDLVALGGVPGSNWEFLGFDVATRDNRSAIRQSPADGRLNAHGLFWSQHDAQAFLESTGGTELVPVQRLRRSAIDPANVLWFTLGNEFNPGDPFGRVVIAIDDASRVTLEHYSRQGNATYTAQLGAGVLDEIRSELARGGFPHVPQHQIPGGAAIRQLELLIDGEPGYALLYDDFGKQLDGYDSAFGILDSITLQLTGYSNHDTRRTPVSNVQRVS